MPVKPVSSVGDLRSISGTEDIGDPIVACSIQSEGGLTMADDPKIESGELEEENIEVTPAAPTEGGDGQDLAETGASVSYGSCSCCIVPV